MSTRTFPSVGRSQEAPSMLKTIPIDQSLSHSSLQDMQLAPKPHMQDTNYTHYPHHFITKPQQLPSSQPPPISSIHSKFEESKHSVMNHHYNQVQAHAVVKPPPATVKFSESLNSL